MKKIRLISSILLLILLSGKTLNAQHEFTFSEKKELQGYQDYTYEAEYSPFRSFFAITIGNNTIEIYNKDWDKVYTYQGNPDSRASLIAFSPDERFLAISKYKSANDIAIIRLTDLKLIQILNGHSDYIMDIVFSPDGKYLASVSNDKSTLVWKRNIDNFELFATLNNYENDVTGVSFSFDSKFLATCSNDSRVAIYETSTNGFKEYQNITSFRGYMKDIVFHPQKMEFFVGDYNGMKYYALRGKKFEPVDSIETDINGHLSISPTGDYIAYGEYNKVNIVSINNNRIEVIDNIYRHSDHVFGGYFSDDGKFLITTSSDKCAVIWEIGGVSPSEKALLSSYLGKEFTYAQKMILSSSVLSKIIESLDESLTPPKDEFETTADFQKRRETLSNMVLRKVQDNLEIEYKIDFDQKSQMVSIPVDNIIGYNADKEIYKIVFMETEAGVNIPVAEAKILKENWSKARIRARRKLDLNTGYYTYSDFDLVIPGIIGPFKVAPLENPFMYGGIHETERAQETIVNTVNTTADNTQTQAGRTIAVLFATNIYDSFSELINPVFDAQTIAQELNQNYGFQTEIIENPTLDQIITTIRGYAQMNYNPNDELFIFFAGHGIYDEVFKEGYIISTDSRAGDLSKTSYLSHSNLRTMINNIPCNHILLVMDVCFGGTFDPLIASRSRGTEMYSEVDVSQFVERKMAYKSRMYITSGGKEYVPDGRPGYHSPFARKVLEAFRDYGGSDKILTLNEIIQYIEKVEPQPRCGEFGDNEPGSDFLFMAQ